jgi:hypothetical protein
VKTERVKAADGRLWARGNRLWDGFPPYRPAPIACGVACIYTQNPLHSRANRGVTMSSVLKKRRKKMRKHKFRKLRRKQKFLRRRIQG